MSDLPSLQTDLSIVNARLNPTLRQRNALQSINRRNLETTQKPTFEQALKAAKEFEQVFVAQIFRSLFEGVELDESLGGSHAENLFQDQLLDEYAREVTKNNSFGIADAVLKDILKLQEGIRDESSTQPRITKPQNPYAESALFSIK